MGRRTTRSAALLGALALFGPVACAEIIGSDFGDYTEVDGDDAGEQMLRDERHLWLLLDIKRRSVHVTRVRREFGYSRRRWRA